MNYKAPRWLPGGHLQTIYPALYAPRPRVVTRRERWDTPDGDFIDLDWTTHTVTVDAPLLVLFHGLEGSARSHYAQSFLAACNARGWRAVVPHFRGCSGELNRLPRAYHSGDSAEIGWVLQRLHTLHPDAPLFVVGISLGGNALAKWLGEQQQQANFVQAAACISAPLDLTLSALSLARGVNRLYTRNFLNTLKPKSLEKARRFPGIFDVGLMMKSRSFHEFDDIVTAPLHGFRNAQHYWQVSSGKQFLASITVPTLVLNALNDPFLPAHTLPRAHEVSKSVTLEQPRHGGHVGFPQGHFPGNLDWLPERVLRFFERG